ncbi:MAG TPA: glucose-6-phosphate isomerase [Saprospiraceae bacterium]|nr:glucose-6-phosphate isomerase [Saprospiraceae bacterium]
MQIDIQGLQHFLSDKELSRMTALTEAVTKDLEKGKGAGAEFTGWLDLPTEYDKKEFERIIKAGRRIKRNSDAVVVIGIGGSYLGAKAAYEFLAHPFQNQLGKAKSKAPELYFAGINLSADYHQGLLDVLESKDWSIIMISKSGTTTEPAIAFRILKEKLEAQYGKTKAAKRIFAITDAKKGALRKLSEQEGYETFVVPDDVGGRFSVLTAVGLLPLAAVGIDIKSLMKGAANAMQDMKAPFGKNIAMQYAALRNILYNKGKSTEIMVSFEPRMTYLMEWWKQLFGESEGKENKGIFPASAIFTADLHSLGQYIQEGRRNIFETALVLEKVKSNLKVPRAEKDLDGLGYLEGKSLHYINDKAIEGVRNAHVDGEVPNIRLVIPKADALNLGYLFYFFEKACAISGYLLGVNPFDQPGVEAYKRNMFELLEKPGY